MKRHGLQPRTHCNQPQRRPDRAAMSELRHPDQHDEERPPRSKVPGEIRDSKTLEKQQGTTPDQEQAPENAIGIDPASLVHTASVATLLISTPPMIASPLTISLRPPGAALVRISAPPMIGTVLPITSHPSGTLISMPPHITNSSIVAGPCSMSAFLRSSSHPPMKAMMRAPE